MRERSSKKRPRDPNQLAAQIVEDATSEELGDFAIDSIEGKNPAAVALGWLGGKKGGKARAQKLTPEQRSEQAKKAAQARWQKDQT